MGFIHVIKNKMSVPIPVYLYVNIGPSDLLKGQGLNSNEVNNPDETVRKIIRNFISNKNVGMETIRFYRTRN